MAALTVAFVIAALLFEAALVASLREVRRLWRGEASRYDGRPLRVKRTAPVLIGSAIVWIPLALATGATGDTEQPTVTSTALVSVTLLWLFLGCMFAASVYLVGRPSQLVPPRLRRH